MSHLKLMDSNVTKGLAWTGEYNGVFNKNTCESTIFQSILLLYINLHTGFFNEYRKGRNIENYTLEAVVSYITVIFLQCMTLKFMA